MADTPAHRAERRALALSLAATVVVGAVGIVWGILSGSRLVLFDAVYTLAGVVLIGVSMLASRASDSAPTRDHPFGKHAATPLAVGLQGAALLGTVAYGAADAIIVIVDGGSEAAGGSVLAYGIVTAAASVVVLLFLRPHARVSSLARTELVSWRAGMLLSLVVAVGGGVAVLLTTTGAVGLAGLVDPALVLVACAGVVPMAFGLIREASRELLEAAPAEPLRSQIDAAVREGITAGATPGHTLPEPLVRATKLGRRLYVEVDFVVDAGQWRVDEEDVVRRAITERLDALGFETWATIELTTDPALAAD